MTKVINSFGKKTVALVLCMLMIVTLIPFTTAGTKAEAATSRAGVVQYMRDMASIKWSCKSTIYYWSYDGKKEFRTFKANTTYTGMPYTQNNRVNLDQFKSKLNGSTYVGGTSSGSYAGNDCSWSVRCAWTQIAGKNISFSYTGNMFPGSGTGIKAVGSYNAGYSTTSTKTITTKNGASTMYASYAQLKPGDAIMARVSGVVNHTRLVVSVSGSGASGKVKVIEQCGLSSKRGTTTWNVDTTYTFSQLYSTYYIPLTCSALQGASDTDKPATGPSTLSISNYNTPSNLGLGKSFSIYGTVKSNYNIKKVTVGIYSSSGKAFSEHTATPNSTSFSISSIDKYVKFANATAGTNKYKIVATDAKTTKTLVDKSYTVGGGSGGSGGSGSAASTLKVTDYNYPTELKQGKSFTISGTVSSNYKITSLTVGIYTSSGSSVSTKTVKPNAKSYSISKVDSYVKFGQAKVGKNYYKIKATDEKQTKTLLNKEFTVTGSSGSGGTTKEAASTLALKNYNYPTTLTVGKSFTIKGDVMSNYNITNVTVGIYNANGTAVSTKSAKPNSKTYAIGKLDAYVKFGKAAAGTNYYKISATDTKKTATLLNKAYTVKADDPASTLKIASANYPTTLDEGASFTIKGTISSNYKITSVTVGIYTTGGASVSSKTVAPNAKSYSLASIDNYIKFGLAKAGKNVYKVVAKDEKKSATLINQTYTVKAKAAVASTLKLDAGYTAPTTLTEGSSFTLSGTISSNYKITSVTAGIYNANGGAVSIKTVSPNSTKFNIATIDSSIKFGSAKAGTNYYKITASDEKQSNKVLLNKAFTVTATSSAASTLSISGQTVPSDTMDLGKSFTVKGTVSSNYNITNVTVGVYDANGKAVSEKSVAPNKKSYDIYNIDAYVKFGLAQAGVNYYRVKATDAKQTKTLVDKKYTVKGSTAASTLTITGHNVPTQLTQGSSYTIGGTISSNYTITSVTVGIYTPSGAAVSAKTVSPNALSYSISKIDTYIKFGSAAVGDNYYRITATDSKQTKQLVNAKYTVVANTGGGNTGGGDFNLTGNMADDIVAVAKSQVGVSGRPNTYTYWMGKIDCSDGRGATYSYAWCATFVSWCAYQAGVPTSVIKKTASCWAMATAFPSDVLKDPSSYNPVKGDILFFDNSNTDGAYNHVGIVVSYDASTGAIKTIEGNTSSASQANGNTVAEKTRYKNTSGFKVSAFAHPKYTNNPVSSSSKPSSSSTSSTPSSSGSTVSYDDALAKAFAITAAFEGRGYVNVSGNFDGAGISVGMFQWNIGSGSLQPLLTDYVTGYTSEAKVALGEDYYNGIVDLLAEKTVADQLTWVIENMHENGSLKADWRAALENMCRQPNFQQIQRNHTASYVTQAKSIFRKYGLTTERSLALCFDIAIQNWTVKDMVDTTGMTEAQKQQALVQGAVNTTSKWKDDVRSRKSTIANGTGTVHGKTYNLKNEYGLGDAVVTGI